MINSVSIGDVDFDLKYQETFNDDGVVVIPSYLSTDEVTRYRTAVLNAFEKIKIEISDDRLRRANEVGVVRAPLKFEPGLTELLSNSKLRKFALDLIGPGTICHLMNGLVLPPKDDRITGVFQGKFHQDFPRFLNRYIASINTFVCLDDFTMQNGATRFVKGSHQRSEQPSAKLIRAADTAVAPVGSLLIFDSTIWHAAGSNNAQNERVGLNVQWTKSFIKQQIDLVRYLGVDACSTFSQDVQAALGMHSRVVESLDEYYVPQHERLYQPNQG